MTYREYTVFFFVDDFSSGLARRDLLYSKIPLDSLFCVKISGVGWAKFWNGDVDVLFDKLLTSY